MTWIESLEKLSIEKIQLEFVRYEQNGSNMLRNMYDGKRLWPGFNKPFLLKSW